MILAVCGIWMIVTLALGGYWSREIGWKRASIAAGLRLGWTLPLILSLFPETISQRIPGTIARQPVHILLDDSASMGAFGVTSKVKGLAGSHLGLIDDVCMSVGCLPKLTRMSELSPDVKKGFSPISQVLEPWLYKTGGEPWILITDGGDFRPAQQWSEGLRGKGAPDSTHGGAVNDRQKYLGLIIGVGEARSPGINIESVHMHPIAFEGKSVSVSIELGRTSPKTDGLRRVQVQVSVDGKIAASGDAVFAAGAGSSTIDFTFTAPRRGPHIVSVAALPVEGELDLWDNTQTRVLDVVPNTIGVLHLLGQPAWDGRFVRRFLKSEPKFDVVSFFILRDPWDSQQVNDREMSLIPFPVERLFKEELANFRVIVMQNFTLMRFLQPEFQQNLAKFVMDGGGLLFIGGPRALTETDVTSSSLAGLMPFEFVPGADGSRDPVPDLRAGIEDAMAGMGSTYDTSANFTIELANPDAPRRALANVYENWVELAPRLTSAGTFKGLHHMGQFKFRDQDVTPLLNARMKSGQTVPLAVASYPGKGRALWLFSDSLWNLAMTPDSRNARGDYHDFLDGAMTWLTRGEMRGALSIREFAVLRGGDDEARSTWSALIAGSAARYLKTATQLRVNVCGTVAKVETLSFGGASGDAVTLSGDVGFNQRGGGLCQLTIDAIHPAFGSLSVSGWSLVPAPIGDQDLGPSPAKLRQLAAVTGARLAEPGADQNKVIQEWATKWGLNAGKSMPDKMKSVRDFYWPLSRSWIWLALILIPLEVLTRRWHLLLGGKIS
jgi:hypothetical protein